MTMSISPNGNLRFLINMPLCVGGRGFECGAARGRVLKLRRLFGSFDGWSVWKKLRAVECLFELKLRNEREAWLIAQQNVINFLSRLINVTNWGPFILICFSLSNELRSSRIFGLQWNRKTTICSTPSRTGKR